ncbi:pilus assembly protein [Noviherbaspirillum sp. ST9]|uniref:pilus assembly protein n=1 Tax=Noviherbaspirillum sp. ST9 TaxID=3401606 RepID=UPI003B587B74
MMSWKLLFNWRLQAALMSAGFMLASATRLAGAATDLSDVPLANASSVTVLPNIAFVLDDSGSMSDENMPNDGDTNLGRNCYGWYRYNTLAYNPAQLYRPPMKSDGTRYPNAVFTSALKDGYFGESEKQFDNTKNSTVNLSTPGNAFPTTAVIAFEPFGKKSSYYVTSIKVKLLDGTSIELMKTSPAPSDATGNVDTLGSKVRDSINELKGATGFSATYNSATDELILFAPTSQAGLTSTPTITRVNKGSDDRSVTITPFTSIYYATHKTTPGSTACDSNASYATALSPSQIAAPGVATGSADALTNFANWYSYYRKRAYLMKAGVGEAFSKLENGKFRVGLFFINGFRSKPSNSNLQIDAYAGDHRATWFSRLYGAHEGGTTPLRGALSRMGQMYAGKIGGWDPVQYSCQRNYTILSTDGYWNEYDESSAFGPLKSDGATEVGDQDGTSDSRPSKDDLKAPNTLADVAYYYYHNDLRPGACSAPDVCTNNVAPSGTNSNVDDVATHQHMTTFTLGLGVSGSLSYTSGYKTSAFGDYFAIKEGSKSWPHPNDNVNDSAHRIDDLWHAAVNGRGTYFSAKDPVSLANSLASSLNAIEAVSGSGAAAATSNLQPTTGDQSIYIANYRSVHWDGDISSYTVNLLDGKISSEVNWEAGTLLASTIKSPGNADTRTIYTSDGTTRTLFKEGTGGLTTAQLAFFNNAKLSQFAEWSDDRKSTATSALLVNYLRGHYMHEDQDGNAENNRLYRDRQKVLGDIIHSQPVYVKAPPHDFKDDGYFEFKSDLKDRTETLYVAANDGMLHAFNATTGEERWAYVPPIVIPEMWQLADKTYSANHRFFLDGPITISDAKIGGSWKTILVGALGKGGRGYYALDITNPSDPKPLWSFAPTATENHNIGYSYGTPFITKLNDDAKTWVAVLTSGYNNIPEGGKYMSADGKGYVFVVNLATGSLIRSTSTNEGSVASPSGLARINVEVEDFSRDNTAVAAYGGDLYGNMWRFDLATGAVRKVAVLGSSKPVTAGPEIGDIDGKKVIFFGTGRYLGTTDLSKSASADTQSIYGIRDDGTTTVSGTSGLVQQTVSTGGTTRNISTSSVDWNSGHGWFFNLPEAGERVAIEPQLYFGTLVVASIVPEATECQPGGHSWLYQVDYRTGGNVTSEKPAASFQGAPIVGVTVSKLPGGSAIIYPVPADGRKPLPVEMNLPPSGSTGGSKRVLWRVLSD